MPDNKRSSPEYFHAVWLGFFCFATALWPIALLGAGVDLLAEADLQIEQLPARGLTTTFAEAAPKKLRLQFEFGIFNREEFAGLELETGMFPFASWRLNGSPLLPPVRDMAYRCMQGLSIARLKDGENILEVVGEPGLFSRDHGSLNMILETAQQDHMGVKLRGLSYEDMAFKRGPILSDLTPTSVTIACQINLSSDVFLNIADQNMLSKSGLHHVFHVSALEPDQAYSYTLTAGLTNFDASVQCGPFVFRTPPEEGPVRLAITGYSGAGPNPIARLAAAIAASSPHAVVIAGPLMQDPLINEVWDVRFLLPCAALLRTIPVYLLPTPNERVAPLLPLLFPGRETSRNWSRGLGPVRIVGLDSSLDWKPGTIHSIWLERTLDEAGETFVIAMILPSLLHDDNEEIGKTKSTRNLMAWMDFLFPLLAKHKTTVLLLPDLRLYYRCESAQGLCLAGSLPQDFLSAMAALPKDSLGFRKQGNEGDYFLLFDIDENQCEMRAMGMDGKEFDACSWRSRGK